MSLACPELPFDPEEPTDIEIALHILQLLDEYRRFSGRLGGKRAPAHGRDAILGLAKTAAQTMTNPYARKLLLDRLGEQ